MTSRILRDVEIEPPRYGAKASAWLWASFSLLGVGVLLLTGFAGYAFFSDGAVPLIVKVGSGVAALGLFGVLVYVLRVRARAVGRDPYEEIDQ